MKALIVEDEAEIARFVAQALENEGYRADCCVRGADALAKAQAVQYDIILLDWMLPDRDGVSVCAALRRMGCVAPVLMLTARGEVRDRIRGLDTGADDYVVKPFDVRELLSRVRALSRRSRDLQRLQIGELGIDHIEHVVSVQGKILDLTTREYALLMCLVEHRGHIVDRAELLQKVWATNNDPGSRVVEVHVSRLRDKMGPLAWMVDTVRGKGYRLREDRP